MQSFKSLIIQLQQIKADLNDVLEELGSLDTYNLTDAERYVSDAADMIDMALEAL